GCAPPRGPLQRRRADRSGTLRVADPARHGDGRGGRDRPADEPSAQPDMNAGAPGVSMRGVRKRYGDTIALNGLDLDAAPGEILGVAGPNGAGKSTMVKILAGEVARDEGEISVDGRPWSDEYGSNRVAVVHQEP